MSLPRAHHDRNLHASNACSRSKVSAKLALVCRTGAPPQTCSNALTRLGGYGSSSAALTHLHAACSHPALWPQIANHLELIKASPDRDEDPVALKWKRELATWLLGDELQLLGGPDLDKRWLSLISTSHCGKLAVLCKLLARWHLQQVLCCTDDCVARMAAYVYISRLAARV